MKIINGRKLWEIRYRKWAGARKVFTGQQWHKVGATVEEVSALALKIIGQHEANAVIEAVRELTEQEQLTVAQQIRQATKKLFA